MFADQAGCNRVQLMVCDIGHVDGGRAFGKNDSAPTIGARTFQVNFCHGLVE